MVNRFSEWVNEKLDIIHTIQCDTIYFDTIEKKGYKMKQGEEKTEFVKEADNPSQKFIFQKNTKTKVAFYFIVTALILLIVAVIVIGDYF